MNTTKSQLNEQSNLKVPCSEAVEKALLSCMVNDADVMEKCMNEVKVDMFFNPANQTIFRCMEKMWNDNGKVDLATLTQALIDSNLLEKCGGAGYVSDIWIQSLYSPDWESHLRILREKSTARKVFGFVADLSERASNVTDIRELENMLQEGMAALSVDFDDSADYDNMKDAMRRMIDVWDGRCSGENQNQGLKTGIQSLDEALGGIRPGEMVTIAAETKGGKTALAVQIAMCNGLEGVPVAIFSLEMSTDSLIERMTSNHARINAHHFRTGKFRKDELIRLNPAIVQLAELPIYIRSRRGVNPLQFKVLSRNFVKRHKCKLIVLDYIQIMESAKQGPNRECEVAEFSRTIKRTASELGIPIIVLSQVNENGRSRESRAIENDSDVFAIIEEEEGNHYINIKYARHCASGRIPVDFKKEFTLFEEK